MTNKEAIEQLKAILSDYRDDIRNFPSLVKDDVDALKYAIAALSRDRWISVEERLIRSGWYLVACNEWGGSAVRKAIFDEATAKWLEFPCGGPKDITKIVTHWRPLPEPPKEET